jgi:hypothetical protein
MNIVISLSLRERHGGVRYMRLLKESVLQIWKARKASVQVGLVSAHRKAKAIQEKLDRLDERPPRREPARGAHAPAD